MSVYRYPLKSVIGDYLRAGVGMAFTFGPLAAAETSPVATALLAGFGGLFLLFALRTGLRHRCRVELSDAGVSALRIRRSTLDWAGLTDLVLRFYSTRRDRSRGWMQLTLKAPGRALRFDSSLEGFDELITRAAQAAQAKGLALSPATQANLRELGVRFEAPLDAGGADEARER